MISLMQPDKIMSHVTLLGNYDRQAFLSSHQALLLLLLKAVGHHHQ